MKPPMQIITETELLDRIGAFRARHGDMAQTTFGRAATGNANLIKELEEGRSPSLRTVKRVIDYMERKDSDATLHAKLHPPIDGADASEEEVPLPFAKAPVNHTGAFSRTCSSTTGQPTTPPASGSCPSCSNPDHRSARGADELAEGG